MTPGNGKFPTAKLGDLVIEAATGFACGQRAADGVVQLRMNNVTRRGELDWSSFIRVPADDSMLNDYALRTGDVVFNNTNSTEMVGKTALFAGFDEPVVFSNHFTRLRTKADSLAPDFLALWLHSQWQAGLFARICDRWIGQSAVQRNKLLALEIPLPPLEEQRRIAARLREQLSILAEARAALEAQLGAAESLPTAYLRAVFESGEARRWQKNQLEKVSEITGGVTLGRDFRGRPTRDVPYLRVANVKDGHLDLTTVKTTPATEEEIAAYQLQRGDVLLTEGGDPDKLGRGTFWDDEISECIHQNHIFRVRFDQTAFQPSFVAYQLASPYGKAYFLHHAKQTTGIATINRRVLGAFPLMTPSLTEQHHVASRLDAEFLASAGLKCALRAKVLELEKLPAVLLRSAFSPNGG